MARGRGRGRGKGLMPNPERKGASLDKEMKNPNEGEVGSTSSATEPVLENDKMNQGANMDLENPSGVNKQLTGSVGKEKVVYAAIEGDHESSDTLKKPHTINRDWGSLFKNNSPAANGMALNYSPPNIVHGKPAAILAEADISENLEKWKAALIVYVVHEKLLGVWLEVRLSRSF